MTPQVPVAKGGEVEAEIKDLAYGGDAVAFYKEFTIYVPYGVPGQTARIRIVEVKRNYASGQLVKVVKESPIHVKSKCPYFTLCGGCHWLNIQHSAQLEYKVKFIDHMLLSVAKLPDVKINKPLVYENLFYYRNRAHYKLKYNGKKIELGFNRAQSHEVVGVEKCMILHPKINELAEVIARELSLHKNQVKLYSEEKQRGYLRYVTIRVNLKGEALVTFVTADKEIKPFIQAAADVLAKDPAVKGVVLNVNQEPDTSVFGKREKIIYGKPYIIETASGIDFALDSATFFQVNAKMLEHMVKFTGDNLSEGAVVLDLYGGVGALTLPSHKKLKNIVIVDIDSSNTDRVSAVCKKNNINNVTVINASAEAAVDRVLNEKRIDEIVIDPPRQGIHAKVIAALKRSNIKKLIYISCNPMTFARDMFELKEKYQLDEITPLDQFSQTYHVELMAVLKLKKGPATNK